MINDKRQCFVVNQLLLKILYLLFIASLNFSFSFFSCDVLWKHYQMDQLFLVTTNIYSKIDKYF